MLNLNNNLIFQFVFFLKHNKLVILIWCVFGVCWWCGYLYTSTSVLSMFSSLIVLTGLLYTSFNQNLREGMYDKEVNILLELMNAILGKINSVQKEKRIPTLFTHEGLIKGYEGHIQNTDDFIIGGWEQQEVINEITSILNSSKWIYLPSDLRREILKLNNKNVNIVNSMYAYSKSLIGATKIERDNLKIKYVTKNELCTKNYKRYVLSMKTFEMCFNENDIKKLEYIGLGLSKYKVNESAVLFDIGEDFKELNSLIYKIYYLSFKKIKKCTNLCVF